MEQPLFSPAEILLPEGALEKWAVLACDQFTSQPEYWEETAAVVGNAPSTLRITLPEVYLEDADVAARIAGIHATMDEYLAGGILQPVVNGLVYLERTMQNGTVRQGLVGAVDLERYSYMPGQACEIKPTEGTVVERIPPRLAVRKGAALESPHILMLVDDRDKMVIEPFAAKKNSLRELYDVELMQKGGRLRGWAVTDAADIAAVQNAVEALGDAGRFGALYNTSNTPFTFAVGDGNHSLATAKAYWEETKKGLNQEERKAHPARYCLVELSNIQSEANDVEPIHRVVFGTNAYDFFMDAQEFAAKNGAVLYDAGDADDEDGADIETGEGGVSQAGAAEAVGGQTFVHVCFAGERKYVLTGSPKALAVASLEAFLADYVAKNEGVTVDYVHGIQAVREITDEDQSSIGIILPPLQKSDLFLGVAQGGVLPRKTFSMGHAEEKRYYMECRRITKQVN